LQEHEKRLLEDVRLGQTLANFGKPTGKDAMSVTPDMVVRMARKLAYRLIALFVFVLEIQD